MPDSSHSNPANLSGELEQQTGKPTPSLTVANLHMRYRSPSLFPKASDWTLNNISFELKKGELLGVLGGNGSGKSTLLKICSGIMSPCEGAVTLGLPHTKSALLSLHAGFEPHLSGEENAIMKGLLWGMKYKEVQMMLDEIFDTAGLQEKREKPLLAYSNGMKARLGFAVALKAQADIFLIDEVMSVGDAAFQIKTSNAIKDKLSQGCSGMIVSHQVPLLKSFCQRIMWLEKGAVKMIGTPDEVCAPYLAWAKESSRSR
jgi:lipopolysaccharide transport system ATP-binding protein